MRRLTVQETREATYNIQLAADILSHPRVKAIPFALPSANVASVLREVVGRLKQRSKALKSDEIDGISHALQTGADYLQSEQIASLNFRDGLFPGREDVVICLRGIVARIKLMLGRKS